MKSNIIGGLVTYPNEKKPRKKSQTMIINDTFDNHYNHCEDTDNHSSKNKLKNNDLQTNQIKNICEDNNVASSVKMINTSYPEQTIIKKYICECTKEFKHNQNLCRHHKTCDIYKKITK
jgi:hypothetical protein